VRVERVLWKVTTQAPTAAVTKAASGAASGGRRAAAASAASTSDGRLEVRLERVAPGAALDSNALYLDEISVTTDKNLRWAVVDVALPPGAAVEASTWGLDLDVAGRSQPLERARHQDMAQGYAVPFEALAAGTPATVRHLVRFSQRGTFKLPPTRLHRMYEPEAKAFGGSGRFAQVEVR